MKLQDNNQDNNKNRKTISKIAFDLKIEEWGALYLNKQSLRPFVNDEAELIDRLSTQNINGDFIPSWQSRYFFRGIEEQIQNDQKVLLISFAIPYLKPVTKTKTPHVTIDSFAWDMDYHQVLNGLMSSFSKTLIASLKLNALQVKQYVDTGPFIDREIAYLTGLGHFGRNHMLINKRFGTRFYIGYFYIIMENCSVEFAEGFNSDYEITKKRMVSDRQFQSCSSCNACTVTCPAQICGVETMDITRCIAYLTQTKAHLTEDEMMRMGYSLYGCDLCQNVCPSNQHKTYTLPYERPNTELKTSDLIELLDLTHTTFKVKYGHMGFSWRGLKVIKRNALVVIGNLLRNNTEAWSAEQKILYEAVVSRSHIREDAYLERYYEVVMNIKKNS